MSLPDVEKYIGNSIPVQSITPEMLVKIKIPPAPPRKERGRPGGGRGGGGNRSGGNRGGGGGRGRR